MAQLVTFERPLDKIKNEAIVDFCNGWKSRAAIGRKYGLSPEIVLELQKQYDPHERNRGIKVGGQRKPRTMVALPAEETAPAATGSPPKRHQPETTIAARLIGLVFILIALAAAGVGANMDWQYGYSVAGISGGVVGLVVEAGALFFLPAARELLRQRNPLCAIAFLAWLPFLCGSSYAALNYTGVTIGDYFQTRGDNELDRAKLNEQLKREEAKRSKIQENGDAKVLENQMNLALGMVPKFNRTLSKDCTEPTPNFSKDVCANYNSLKDAWTNAVARDRLEASIAELGQKLSRLPHVASKNPAGEQVAQITGGRIDQEQAASYSIRWWAIVPGFASIMMTIGLALCSKKVTQ